MVMYNCRLIFIRQRLNEIRNWAMLDMLGIYLKKVQKQANRLSRIQNPTKEQLKMITIEDISVKLSTNFKVTLNK